MLGLFRIPLALVLCCMLSGHASTAGQTTKAGPKGGNGGGTGGMGGVGGVIQSVDSGTITITVHHHNNGSGSSEPQQKTFKISSKTTVETISKGENGPVTSTSTIEALKSGQHVHITAQGGAAQKIAIMEFSKKKTSKTN
jgi:hypothetical protein